MEHRVVLDHREPVETAARRRVFDGGADREPGRESFCVVVRHGDVARDELLAPRDGGAAARVVLARAHLCARGCRGASAVIDNATSSSSRVDGVEVMTQQCGDAPQQFDLCTAAHGDRDDVAVFEPRARDGFERARRRPARGHDAENATRVGGREGREGEPGSFHYFYNVMPSIYEIFGSL